MVLNFVFCFAFFFSAAAAHVSIIREARRNHNKCVQFSKKLLRLVVAGKKGEEYVCEREETGVLMDERKMYGDLSEWSVMSE